MGVDLGVNTLIAATDGEKALLVSGREAKATVQWRAKNLASMSSHQSGLKKGSRRWRRTQRRKYKMLDKARNRIRDITHKATRKVADTFPGAKIYVSLQPKDHQSARLQNLRGGHRPRALQLADLSGMRVPAEMRIYKCQQCGFKAPRDVVGSLNIYMIGKVGKLQANPDLEIPRIIWVYPSKYPGSKPGSSGGIPASSSFDANQMRSPSL